MNVVSLFTGIGGLDLGLERAGLRVLWQCEADEWRRSVLRAHWPDVACHPDVRGVPVGEPARGRSAVTPCDEPIGGRRQARARVPGSADLVCGGFPCQDLSVAGKRAGLAGERSGLFFEFTRAADALLSDGGWVRVENVPGLLSSNGGRDFAVILATLADLGFHDLAWRVLDSRHFGVPQRRRRVYILARRARGRRACQVLLEPESGGGHPQANNGPREDVAHTLTPRTGSRHSHEDVLDYVVTAFDSTGGGSKGLSLSDDFAPGTGTGRPAALAVSIRETQTVRRLTPTECERLQGFPDGWTAHGSDSRRYAALSDAVTVPVAQWIGQRLLANQAKERP